MPDSAFTIGDAKRVLEHPDLPAAYVSWCEVLPLAGHADREHVGNLLGWSTPAARRPLGASRDIFKQALCGANEDTMDEWMAFLGSTPTSDFVDHHLPFLRNLRDLRNGSPTDTVILQYLLATGEAPDSDPQPRLRRDAPDSLIIEVTRSCNFGCTMCSMTGEGFLPSRTMPVELFGELVRVLSPGAASLRINGYGETSIVPDLHRWLGCLDVFGFRGRREIITNLSAPDDVYIDLFDRGFVILVSWDAARAETFEAIRRGGRYRELLDRLKRLGTHAGRQPERLGLLMTVQEKNLGEVVSVTELAGEIGAGLVILNMVKESDGSPWMDERIDEIRALFAEVEKSAARAGIALRLPDHVGRQRVRLMQARRSSGTFCDRPWRELLVRWDTEMTVCNMFNPFSYGVLRPPGFNGDTQARFSRLWTGPNARLFRRLINSEQPHPYCKECYYLYP